MIVIDAGTLTAALVDDGAMGAAARSALREDVHWIAPAHLLVEVLSAIRGLVLGGKLSVRRGGDAVRALDDLVIEVIDPAGLVERMWDLRHNLSAYDAAYVAAAEDAHCTLVTADEPLSRVPRLRCPVHIVRPS